MRQRGGGRAAQACRGAQGGGLGDGSDKVQGRKEGGRREAALGCKVMRWEQRHTEELRMAAWAALEAEMISYKAGEGAEGEQHRQVGE